jgi:8-oxo-dGTP pyrophosphatase MutT (NUDIX family)
MPRVVSHIVEVYPFRFLNDHIEYLVLRRAATDDLYPGIWQIVTGNIRREETAVEAALREFHEETDLIPIHFWQVPAVGAFYDHRADEVNLCPIFACQVRSDALPTMSSEHSHFAWVDRHGAERLLVWPSQRENLTLVDRVVVGGEDAAGLLELPLQ